MFMKGKMNEDNGGLRMDGRYKEEFQKEEDNYGRRNRDGLYEYLRRVGRYERKEIHPVSGKVNMEGRGQEIRLGREGKKEEQERGLENLKSNGRYLRKGIQPN